MTDKNNSCKKEYYNKSLNYLSKHKTQARKLLKWISYSIFVLSCSIGLSIIILAGKIDAMKIAKTFYHKIF